MCITLHPRELLYIDEGVNGNNISILASSVILNKKYNHNIKLYRKYNISTIEDDILAFSL